MPLRASGQDGVLTSDDLDFLQEVYEAATADIANVDDATMHDIVERMIMYYRAGERDRYKLASVAKRDLRRAG